MSSPSHHPHDRFFKTAFSHRELMEEYVQYFMPKKLAEQIDLSSLEQQKESYLSKNLEQYFSDVVYIARYGKSRVHITLLLEHKSYIPPHPWLQLLQYMVNAYLAQASQPGFKGKFTIVIPIIVYHGRRRWKIRSVASYFGGIDEELKKFIPEFVYLLNDLGQIGDAALLSMGGSWIKRAFLALNNSRKGNSLEALAVVFKDLTDVELHHILLDFINSVIVYLLKTGNKIDQIMSAINSINSPAREKIRSAYDQILQMGKEKGIREGIEKGIQEGMEKGILEERLRKNFQVFRKGIQLGMSVAELVLLTEVDEETAQSWYALLSENPEAELPKV